jgi:hypothetical protein
MLLLGWQAALPASGPGDYYWQKIIRCHQLPVNSPEQVRRTRRGVVLLFEAVSLMSFMRDVADSKKDLFVCLLVALSSVGLPSGYLAGMILGTILAFLIRRGWVMRG